MGFCTIESLEGKHSLVRTTDVLESGGVSELHNGTQKINGPALSFQMNRDSIMALRMDE